MDRIDVNPTAVSPRREAALRNLYATDGLLRDQDLFGLFLARARTPTDRPVQQPPPSATPTDASMKTPSNTDYHEPFSATAPSESVAESSARAETVRDDRTHNSDSLDKPEVEKDDPGPESSSSNTSDASAAPAQERMPAQAIVQAETPSEAAPAEIAPTVETLLGGTGKVAVNAETTLSAESDRMNPPPSEKSTVEIPAPDVLPKAASSASDEIPAEKSQTQKRESAKVSLQETAAAGNEKSSARGVKASGDPADLAVASQAEEKTSRRETRNAKNNSSRPAAAAAISAQSAKAAAPGPVIASTSVTVPQVAFSTVTQTETVSQFTTSSAQTTTQGSTTAALSRQSAGSAAKVAEKAGKSGDGKGNSTMDRVRFVQRVERAFAAVGNRGGTVRMRLNPPELGSLRLEITVRKGEMKARAEAETPAAKSLLLENLSTLRERLAQQNIQVQQFDVELTDRGPGGFSEQWTTHADSGGSQDGYRPPQTNATETAPAATPTAARRWPGDETQLNVLV